MFWASFLGALRKERHYFLAVLGLFYRLLLLVSTLHSAKGQEALRCHENSMSVSHQEKRTEEAGRESRSLTQDCQSQSLSSVARTLTKFKVPSMTFRVFISSLTSCCRLTFTFTQ